MALPCREPHGLSEPQPSQAPCSASTSPLPPPPPPPPPPPSLHRPAGQRAPHLRVGSHPGGGPSHPLDQSLAGAGGVGTTHLRHTLCCCSAVNACVCGAGGVGGQPLARGRFCSSRRRVGVRGSWQVHALRPLVRSAPPPFIKCARLPSMCGASTGTACECWCIQQMVRRRAMAGRWQGDGCSRQPGGLLPRLLADEPVLACTGKHALLSHASSACMPACLLTQLVLFHSALQSGSLRSGLASPSRLRCWPGRQTWCGALLFS